MFESWKMKGRSAESLADQFGSGRAKALPWYALVLVVEQGALLLFRDRLHEALWAVFAAVCALALWHGGGWLFPRKARRLANDESTRANRSDALRLGFAAVLVVCLGLYAATFFLTVSGRQIVHLIVTTALATALFRLGYLERRAYPDA